MNPADFQVERANVGTDYRRAFPDRPPVTAGPAGCHNFLGYPVSGISIWKPRLQYQPQEW